MMDILRIENFSYSYNNDHKAVDSISLSVKEGELFGFIGHNGAGKSTTIKAVAGILPVTKGEIYVDGISIKQNCTECQKRTAYVPDNPDLFEYMTGIGYLNFIADMYEMDGESRTVQIKKYADAFTLTKYLGNLIQSYSHGMKQKIALIAAFMHKPKLLVLDEPFVGLDPKASYVLKQSMKELCEKGSAIFFSTHVLDVAEKICSKVGIMNHGKLVICEETGKLTEGKSLEQIFMEQVQDENE